MPKFDQYKTIIFDCDGVILNSNGIKSEAFFNVTKSYGVDLAKAMQDYHIANGGISRYAKFEYFFKEILRSKPADYEVNNLVNLFARQVRDNLLFCDVSDGLKELKNYLKHSKWLVVSGGDQNELQEVFGLRGLSEMFDGGIFGSPDAKEEILEREIANNNIVTPALFLGDSKYDYSAATGAGLDFMFVSNWTEVDEWKSWTAQNNINYIQQLSDLLPQ